MKDVGLGNDCRTLLAVLALSNHNFKVLHWNACGDNFDTLHAIGAKYYDKTNEDEDKVAEICMRLDAKAVSFSDIVPLTKEVNLYNELQCVDVSKTNFYDLCQVILKNIFDAICAVLENSAIDNTQYAGIRSDLEAILSEYDLELNFLNKRRIVMGE